MTAKQRSDFNQGDGISLREHLEDRLDKCKESEGKLLEELRCHLVTLVNHVKDSIAQAKVENDLRLEAMNEFRSALTDQASRFVTRAELDLFKEKTSVELDQFRVFKTIVETKASQSTVNIAIWFSAAGVVIGAISLIVSIMK